MPYNYITKHDQVLLLIRSLLICFYFLWSAHLIGQNPDVDVESWLAATFEYKFNRDLEFGIQEQLRLEFDEQIYDNSFTELKAHYKWKSMTAGVGYRFINRENDEEDLTNSNYFHRWHFFLRHRWKIKRLDMKFKLQIQQRREHLYNTNRFVSDVERYVRSRMTVEYKIRNWKLDPEFGTEFFLRTERGQLNKWRTSLATSYSLSNSLKLAIKYMYEREIKKWNPDVAHICGLELKYTLKRK